MIGTGVGIGVVLGIVLGAVLPNSTGAGRGIVMVLLSLGFAVIGGLFAGVIATRLDKPLKNQADGPLFPQDAIVTEKVATREAAADAVAGSDASADDVERAVGDDATADTDLSIPESPPKERPNGDPT